MDIVERLRKHPYKSGNASEAATEIERLRKKVETLEADRKESVLWWANLADDMNDEIEQLREALQEVISSSGRKPETIKQLLENHS